jgi:hypothetical protein
MDISRRSAFGAIASLLCGIFGKTTQPATLKRVPRIEWWDGHKWREVTVESYRHWPESELAIRLTAIPTDENKPNGTWGLWIVNEAGDYKKGN